MEIRGSNKGNKPMGEWFIEQKAKRYKLKQSVSLARIKEGTLFDQKVEKKTISFHAEGKVALDTLSENTLLVVSYAGEGNAKLMRGLEEIGIFGTRETERIKKYMLEHLEFGGLMPVKIDHLPLDGGMDVIAVI
jgi:hypothetical protein